MTPGSRSFFKLSASWQPGSLTKVLQKFLASVEICRNLITASLLQPNSEAQGSPEEEAVEIGNS
jgi:hypothetical protein